MPFLELSSHRLHYQIDAPNQIGGDRPWLLFCNSLGTDLSMWDAQASDLAPHFRILRYDRRGHGNSSAPAAPYTLADLASDVLALLDAFDIAQTHFCGLSIGGLVGQWLAIHAGDRIGKLVLCATAAKIGTAEGWQARIDAVRQAGLGSLTAGTVERWFSPDLVASRPEFIQTMLKGFLATSPIGYIGCCAALAEADLRLEIGRIDNPVLAVSAEGDEVCPPTDLAFIAGQVRLGRHMMLPGRHIVNAQDTCRFSTDMLDFLSEET
ncbi:3-oxoadipate enol-lactonase (plasmid) [Rhizobium sp. CB3060]|uniref:3-oxoadipate enol-lactonase n=1 Tax=Rhizobium sp. CB3060 TaxID=3138255 RepID=UPI0021A7FEC8|nr:3-oxoadipate enol-lactonase [Rhizobium tropici]UWU26087.1 3-oxoadipate enol-lactonase [Rhizobium tropici]